MISPLLIFSPKVERSDDITVITFTFTGRRVQEVENPLASELDGRTGGLGEGHLLLDFTNVEIITGAELGTLITLRKKMKASGGRLTLFNLNTHVYEIFTITNLHTLFGISREEIIPLASG